MTGRRSLLGELYVIGALVLFVVALLQAVRP